MTFVVGFDALESSGIRSKFFEGAPYGGVDISFFLVDVDPGDGPALHAHPYPEVFVVQDGEATFTVGDERHQVGAGHVVVAPAGVPHRFVNAGTSSLRTVNIHPVSRMVTEWIEA